MYIHTYVCIYIYIYIYLPVLLLARHEQLQEAPRLQRQAVGQAPRPGGRGPEGAGRDLVRGLPPPGRVAAAREPRPAADRPGALLAVALEVDRTPHGVRVRPRAELPGEHLQHGEELLEPDRVAGGRGPL